MSELDRIANALERIAHSLDELKAARKPGPKAKRKSADRQPITPATDISDAYRLRADRALRRKGLVK